MSTRREVWIVCNECGSQENTHTDASGKARVWAIENGWSHPAFATDLCPECTTADPALEPDPMFDLEEFK